MTSRMFKDRTAGFWIGIAAAAIAIIGAIVYIAVDVSDRTFSIPGFILMLLGGLSFAIVLLTDYRFAPAVPAVLGILGFAFTVCAAIPSLSDVWNHVVFIGGNAAAGVAFSIVFLVSAILSVISCFMDQRKTVQD
ncbi:MAG: hypothetical protein LUE27_04630 [Clostridia bacterium]|nr:hypothetical protein [Clostridia bacterium]